MPGALRSGPDDDLGLPWDRLGDGRVWQLEHGQDYHVDTRALNRAADVAAGRMGKVACIAAERITHVGHFAEYAWVQFVDHDVLVGMPCPCGSRELIRTHPNFARCPACGAHLKLSSPREEEQFAGDGSDGPSSSEATREAAARAKAIARGKFRCKHDERFAFEQYTEVAFVATESRPRCRHLYGRAVDPLGMPVLIWVEYRSSDGPEMDDGPDESGEVCRVHRWPIPAFSDLVHLERAPVAAGEPPVEGSFGDAHDGDDRWWRGRLHRFSKVTLVYQEELPDRERFYGHAVVRDGTPALIYVDYPLLDGARVKVPDDDEAEQHFVYRWPVAPFGSIIDLSPVSRSSSASKRTKRRRKRKRVDGRRRESRLEQPRRARKQKKLRRQDGGLKPDRRDAEPPGREL